MAKSLKELVSEEFKKCAADPAYFMRKYCIIQHPIKGKMYFALWKFQEKLLHQFKESKYNVVLKSRQLGISTLVAGYALWLMLFHSDKNILVIATKQGVAKNLVTKVRVMHQNLPVWLRGNCVEDNKLSLRFANGSQIKAESSAPDAGRSEALSLLVLDEAAFIKDIDSIWAASSLTLATGGDCIMLSTPNGVGNLFHKIWKFAEEGLAYGDKFSFNPLKLHWSVHPERDIEWRRQQDEILGQRLAAQECFDAETRICTRRGFVPISKITTADFVLTHTGIFRKVTNVIENPKTLVKQVHTSNNRVRRMVTANHPFLTSDGKFVPVSSINNNIIEFPRVELCNAVPTIDIFSIIHPKFFKKILCDEKQSFYINDRRHKMVHKRFIEVGYKLGVIIGLYLAEGYSNRLRVDFSFNYERENSTWPKLITEYVSDLFGITSHQIRKQENCGHLTICSEVLCSILTKFTDGEDARTKCLSTFAYENANSELFNGILYGLFVGDGTVSDKYNKQISQSSDDMMYDVLYMSRMLNVFGISFAKYDRPSIVEIDGRVCNTKPYKYDFRFKQSKFKSLNETIGTINAAKSINTALIIENAEVVVPVYNLEVEIDNSYVTEHGVVHNCDCDFITSGNTVIEGSIIKWYEDTMVKDPIEKKGIDHNLWIWEFPDYAKTYVVSADVARGDGNDFSTAQVVDVENLVQVAEYKGQLGTKDFGNFLVGLATEYNDALLVIENNAGWNTIQQAIDRGYKNLLYTSPDLTKVDVQTQVLRGYDTLNPIDSTKLVPGFSMTTKTRPIVVSKVDEYFRNKDMKIFSKRLVSELYTWIWESGKADHLAGYNDDTIIAMGIALLIRDTALKLKQVGIEMHKQALSNIRVVRPIYTPNQRPIVDPFIMQLGGGYTEDIRWLVGVPPLKTELTGSVVVIGESMAKVVG
jgi:hypothetical protein